MFYRAELEFLRSVLRKMQVQSHLLQADTLPEDALDFGLRTFLGREEEYGQALQNITPLVQDRTVYKLTDSYFCNYIFFTLPETQGNTSLLIGPYMTFWITSQQVLEAAERFNLTSAQCNRLEEYYRNIPVMSDDSALFALITSFSERLWGTGNAYEIVDLNQDVLNTPLPSHLDTEKPDADNTLLQMNLMETRYTYENELMENVSKGLIHRAERMLLRAFRALLEQRSADPIRNLKNHAIICNTLLRKAAEQGGVHPIHLDRTSAAFARRIETISGPEAGQALMTEMVQTYCQLVRRQSTKQYSPLIQKVVSYIEADLSGDLNLSTLAAVHSINPSYLSALFRRETGKTVTEFVNEKRVDLGAHLLRSTRLQVQTIAQYCGMPDANYFSKLFKKQLGQTPKQFRASHEPKRAE